MYKAKLNGGYDSGSGVCFVTFHHSAHDDCKSNVKAETWLLNSVWLLSRQSSENVLFFLLNGACFFSPNGFPVPVRDCNCAYKNVKTATKLPFSPQPPFISGKQSRKGTPQKKTITELQIGTGQVLLQDVCVWQNMVGHLQWNFYLQITDMVHLHRIKITDILHDYYERYPGNTSPVQIGNNIHYCFLHS